MTDCNCNRNHRTDVAQIRCILQDRDTHVIGEGNFAVIHECRSGNGRGYTRWLRAYLHPTLEEARADYAKRAEYCYPGHPCSGTCVGQWNMIQPLRADASMTAPEYDEEYGLNYRLLIDGELWVRRPDLPIWYNGERSLFGDQILSGAAAGLIRVEVSA